MLIHVLHPCCEPVDLIDQCFSLRIQLALVLHRTQDLVRGRFEYRREDPVRLVLTDVPFLVKVYNNPLVG